MSTETQKTKESTTVRIWREPKKRVEDLARDRSAKEKRTITEAELVSEAVDLYCNREERKLRRA